MFPIVVVLRPRIGRTARANESGAASVELSIVHDTEEAVDRTLRGKSYSIEHRVRTPTQGDGVGNTIGGELVIQLTRCGRERVQESS